MDNFYPKHGKKRFSVVVFKELFLYAFYGTINLLWACFFKVAHTLTLMTLEMAMYCVEQKLSVFLYFQLHDIDLNQSILLRFSMTPLLEQGEAQTTEYTFLPPNFTIRVTLILVRINKYIY